MPSKSGDSLSTSLESKCSSSSSSNYKTDAEAVLATCTEFQGGRTGYPPLDEAMARRLYDHYAPHNEALADLTDLDLSSWRQEKAPDR